MELRRNEWLAKQICRSCPVLEACRNYALDAPEPYGIWGALTPSERQRLRGC
jgi:WhiB family transcriptional regulator, redox-sensing transcriptional regulator